MVLRLNLAKPAASTLVSEMARIGIRKEETGLRRTGDHSSFGEFLPGGAVLRIKRISPTSSVKPQRR